MGPSTNENKVADDDRKTRASSLHTIYFSIISTRKWSNPNEKSVEKYFLIYAPINCSDKLIFRKYQRTIIQYLTFKYEYNVIIIAFLMGKVLLTFLL